MGHLDAIGAVGVHDPDIRELDLIRAHLAVCEVERDALAVGRERTSAVESRDDVTVRRQVRTQRREAAAVRGHDEQLVRLVVGLVVVVAREEKVRAVGCPVGALGREARVLVGVGAPGFEMPGVGWDRGQFATGDPVG